MTDDVALNKATIVRRCLARVTEELQGDVTRLENFTIQDAIVLNLLRACEACIDLAMHRVAEMRLGIPQASRESFELLRQVGVLTVETTTAMKNMVGFRNIAVHSYQQLQRPILEAILRSHLTDFDDFLNQVCPAA